MTNIQYSFTLSPPDRTSKYISMHVINPLKHIYMDDMLIIKHLFKKIKLRNYIIYPELDPKGRLHYHGTLTMTKTILTRFYKYAKPHLQRIGHVDCSPAKRIVEWNIYISKEWPFTKDILEISHLDITPIKLII